MTSVLIRLLEGLILRERLSGGRAYWSWWRQPLTGALDGPVQGATIAGSVEVYGWVVARRAAIRRVEVWLDEKLVGLAERGLERLDVTRSYPWLKQPNCGFSLKVEAEPGAYRLTVRAIDERGRQRDWQRHLIVAARPEVSTEYTYADWITDHEPTAGELAEQREKAEDLAYRPRFSLITPVYNPPLSVLEAMLASVQAQTYPDWELCLVDGDSTDPAVAALLERWATQDERVKVTRLSHNAGIVGNSNQALEQATGEWCGLLDHDDTLASNALYEVALLLNERPELDFIYSDHDLLSEDGQTRHSPLFKPDFSPEIMLSANYMTHLTVIRRSLIEKVGRFAPGTDGAQDWDLFWRVLEQTEAGRVAHIPKVLYHWRESATSTATDIYRKPTAPLNQLHAIENHLHRSGQPHSHAFFDEGLIRVSWPVVGQPLASIIVPTKDKPELIAACVRSVLSRTSYPHFELLIVDTGSTDPAVFDFYRSLEGQPRLKILHYTEPFNYSAVNNWAARQADGDILVFLNNDTEVIGSDWLEELVRWAQLPAIGAVGAQLLKPDGTLQHAGVIVGMGGWAGHGLWPDLNRRPGRFSVLPVGIAIIWPSPRPVLPCAGLCSRRSAVSRKRSGSMAAT